MLLVNHIRDNFEAVLAGLNKRNFPNAESLLNQVIQLDDQRKSSQTLRDQIQAESNAISKQIGMLMKEGKRDEAEKAKARTAEIKAQIKELDDENSRAEEDLKALLYTIPNIPHTSVPSGKSAEDNEVVLEHGDIPNLYDGKQPHWELIKKYDIIDFDLGVKITGAGFPVYKGKGARLQRALINFFLDEALKAGFMEVQPPILVNEDSGYGTGQLPDKEGQMYHATADNLYLIPTAEVPITNLYRDVIVAEDQLPIKNVGYTPCFRREAGSWGAHVRGLNRLHQFDKVEIVQITHPDKSYEALEDMSSYVQGLLQKLELPYRVLRLCGGDMGFTSALTYDMEVYSAAQERWLEVSSVSNFETYQTNRLKLRFKGEDKKTQLAHSLNGSALALPRIVAAILENNQTEEGIKMPKVLHSYLGFEMI
ncbi:MAG TPA: serine--tRNA ligase [Algoriphagus sp.]|mgnify:FL=1|jgi:seryl-tRNA synthetase|uniref:serine--tRNA ligase n=1 Tax=unclassified Algoriphagus TaxID=2641541 RepID=UPI000C4781B3|nr:MULTISPECIES: serine--tRNA ligase [unclassified Algoriphagus]MAL12355.1 serine--tRNA ligase [Algoriphagus sp.]QYH40208.1 serine--tRNA ligase [Algoriphagus sp. NBT04N3]HAH36393.1 serine--tRNA ligase [Algoriphagus sp.]HAS59325.1 serine--tRNA ligase [Algoriphagus sp.]HCB47053.1 serine--tRNA ligase [Algoriphagus sp.]|tara:strand:- start:3167 stop:4438 length:1272 start_codon:yes stop_codon:yes gene_type:complete